MSEDLKKKKSDYLLELALEEQLEQDTEMKKYEKIEETEPTHVFSKGHDERMQEIFKMADKVENKSRKRKRYRQIAAGLPQIIKNMSRIMFRPDLQYWKYMRKKGAFILNI